MKRFKYGISSCLLALTALVVWIGLATNAGAYEGKTNSASQVQVKIIPEQLQAGQEVKFKVSMNTHSVPLTNDLTTSSLLKDSQGQEYRPLRWNGSPPGGHHRSGTLEFPALAKGTKAVTLYINGLANVPERTFEWKVE